MLRYSARIRIDLHGALALTGCEHGTDRTVMLGLLDFAPDTAHPEMADEALTKLEIYRRLVLPDGSSIPFDPSCDLIFRSDIVPAQPPNEMRLALHNDVEDILFEETWCSVGGGFIVIARQLDTPVVNKPVGRH